jgi:calcineurin-like phosphoesterase family protein
MSRVFFIGDLHLGHTNMAIKRGFKDSFDHDNHVISCWNKVVNKKDVVYILGDVAMESRKYYYLLDRMNGKKKVILGNHDILTDIHEMLRYVTHVGGIVKYSRKGYPKMFLTHCPVHPMEFDKRIQLNIHAHTHENRVLDADGNIDPRYISVSCEQVDYTPKTIEQLLGEPIF